MTNNAIQENALSIFFSTLGILLTFLAIWLAWLAYRKTVRDQLLGWHTLLKNFQKELTVHEDFLNGFPEEDATTKIKQDDKNWYNTTKFIHPMTFISGKEILLRAYPPVNNIIPSDFFEKLAGFMQRVDTFNFLLSYLPGIYSTNLERGYDLDKLINQGEDIIGRKVQEIENGENKREKPLLKIASTTHKLHLEIHHKIIGHSGEKHLSRLARELNKILKKILKDWEYNIPWYYKPYLPT